MVVGIYDVPPVSGIERDFQRLKSELVLDPTPPPPTPPLLSAMFNLSPLGSQCSLPRTPDVMEAMAAFDDSSDAPLERCVNCYPAWPCLPVLRVVTTTALPLCAGAAAA